MPGLEVAGRGQAARDRDGAPTLSPHIGVWLKPEALVIHCSEQHGVCCKTVLALRQMGWKKPTFYEPKGSSR
jgi:hypothetical protein